jgi:DNA-binding CsgD family transcriptional regulator
VKTSRVFDWATRDQLATMPDGINLITRTGSVRDIAECHALHESLGLPYSKRSSRILPEVWRTLLSKGAMLLCLVANRAKLVGSRIVSFGAIVFVTDDFCSEARSKLPPYLGVELTRQYLSRQLPVLNREQVAHANAGDGLNVMMCFEGWAQDGLSPGQLFAVRAKQSDALHLALSGYRVKEFLASPIGADTAQWMLDAGARLRRDYSNYFRKNHLPKPESSRRPYLIGLTKQEAFTHPGSNLAGLFVYTTPRFQFNRSQRVLLRHALMGETCEELAKSLSISPWTVKKRWHAIYDRVTDVDTELLPPPIAYGLHAASRGPERRRRLLNYLRQHLEELRPFEPLHGRRKERTFSSATSIFVAATAFFAEYLPCLCENLV